MSISYNKLWKLMIDKKLKSLLNSGKVILKNNGVIT